MPRGFRNRDGGTYDDQDRLLAWDSATFTHTANGERASRTAAGVTTSYAYDLDGNLKGVSGLPGGTSLTCLIDGQNHRVAKKRGATLEQAFVYDGDRIVAELDGSGAVVSRFVYATQAHSPDLVLRGGATYRIVKDHLGSVRLVVNATTGALAQRIDYDVWGNITADLDGAGNPIPTPATLRFQPFGFAGGLHDRDTGFVRFGARDYDPVTARWTSKDRWRFESDTNFYAYSHGDPVNRLDPSGYLDEGGGDPSVPNIGLTPDPPEPSPTTCGGSPKPPPGPFPNPDPSHCRDVCWDLYLREASRCRFKYSPDGSAYRRCEAAAEERFTKCINRCEDEVAR